MASPKQSPPKQPPPSKPQPAPPYTERLQEAMARFNTALTAYNAWQNGMREVWQEMIEAAREMRACGVFLPAMPGEQMQAPPAQHADPDADIKSAISASFAPKPPVTGANTPKTSKE